MVKFPSRDKKPANHGKQIAGVAAGAALIGAVGTALFTPKSGKEVRKDIAKGSKAAVEKAEHAVKDVEKKLHRDTKQSIKAVPKTTTKASKQVKKTVSKRATPSKAVIKKTD